MIRADSHEGVLPIHYLSVTNSHMKARCVWERQGLQGQQPDTSSAGVDASGGCNASGSMRKRSA